MKRNSLKEKFAILKNQVYATFGNYQYTAGGFGEKSKLELIQIRFSGYAFYCVSIKQVSIFYLRTLLKEYDFIGGNWMDRADTEFILSH